MDAACGGRTPAQALCSALCSSDDQRAVVLSGWVWEDVAEVEFEDGTLCLGPGGVPHEGRALGLLGSLVADDDKLLHLRSLKVVVDEKVTGGENRRQNLWMMKQSRMMTSSLT